MLINFKKLIKMAACAENFSRFFLLKIPSFYIFFRFQIVTVFEIYQLFSDALKIIAIYLSYENRK